MGYSITFKSRVAEAAVMEMAKRQNAAKLAMLIFARKRSSDGPTIDKKNENMFKHEEIVRMELFVHWAHASDALWEGSCWKRFLKRNRNFCSRKIPMRA